MTTTDAILIEEGRHQLGLNYQDLFYVAAMWTEGRDIEDAVVGYAAFRDNGDVPVWLTDFCLHFLAGRIRDLLLHIQN